MTELRKRVAYLEGLADGMRLDADSDQGKLFHGLVEALRAVADALESVGSRQEYLEDYLSEVEDRVCALEAAAPEYAHDEEPDDLEVECPHCGFVFALTDGEVEVGEDELDIVCPECGQPLGMPGTVGEAAPPEGGGEEVPLPRESTAALAEGHHETPGEP